MGFTLSYRPLCNINIFHGYYLHPATLDQNILLPDQQQEITGEINNLFGYNIHNDLLFIPDLQTKKLMDNYQIRYKPHALGFSLYIRSIPEASDEFVPFIPIDLSDEVLRFWMKIKNPFFLNFTNLELGKSWEGIKRKTHVYRFANFPGFAQPPTNYLHTYLDSPSRPYYVNTGDITPLADIDPSVLDPEGFGLINIDLNSPDLMDADQTILSPDYTIWFQNRMTYWKYIFHGEIAGENDDSDVALATTNARILISKVSQPLSNKFRPIYYRTDNPTTEEILLPNPEDLSLYPDLSGEIYSEIRMGSYKLITN